MVSLRNLLSFVRRLCALTHGQSRELCIPSSQARKRAFLKKHVRGSDIACRYGGEEFLLILSPSTADGARLRAEKIREDALQLRVSHANQDLGPITLSLGLAIWPDHGANAASIVKAADVALYHAKAGGRNQSVLYVKKQERLKVVEVPASMGRPS